MVFGDEEQSPTRRERISAWHSIKELVLGPSTDMKQVKQSIDQIYDKQGHEMQVEQSFAKGIKRPVKLNDEDKKELLKLIEIVQSRIKKGIINRNFTRQTETRNQLAQN